MRRWGVTYVFNINWHGDYEHNLTILEAIKEARIDTGIRAYCILTEEKVKRFGLTGSEAYVIIRKTSLPTKVSSRNLQIHADVVETSIMANFFPSEVNSELAKSLEPTNLTPNDLLVWRQGWIDARRITPLGYLGDPASFDPMTGKELIENDARNLANCIEVFIKEGYKAPKFV